MSEYRESEASRAATAGAIKKSGWQRLGVVLSILWAVGAPIYIMTDVNRTAGDVYGMCYSSADKRYGPRGYLGTDQAKLEAPKRSAGGNWTKQACRPRN